MPHTDTPTQTDHLEFNTDVTVNVWGFAGME